ncbi:sulfite exporter TauE/SafE family protein [Thalassobaculum sp. OXR-137]|uniref:sulfite exporter TauE/SafE family protein n=1 Tax=Thalassobaculum sp. OXR-137 TaxID=3100173 RepID=UPI002AC8F7A3|nr:sulfite exporter TauE/SafE family protein [Thalassobaculum sp. OXR-137]WPZ34343.1 sulfite exporter TauE/SafE family protein [Thalassobaculum sp. OXR-137]
MDALLALIIPEPLGELAAISLIALSFVTSLMTAALGLGGGILMVAAMASVVPPAALIPVHGLVQLGSNSGRALLFHRFIRRPIVLWFLLGAIVGVTIGAQVAVRLPREVLLVVVGGFVLVTTWMPSLGRYKIPDRGFTIIGAVTAFITMFAGATGPFLAPFLSPERLGDRHATIGTFAACMTLKHGLKVTAFAALGFAYVPWLPLIGLMIVSGFLGTMAGRQIVNRMPEARFRTAFRILLTALALRLLYQGLAG